MKKFAFNAVALAAGVLVASGAFAGTISQPAVSVKYAVEALSPTVTTTITVPTITYTMGVGRPTGNGFTIINTPSAGSTFGTCVVPVPSNANMGITLKRQSATECAYDVQVIGGPTAVGDTLTWTNQTFPTHPLATVGSTLSVSINLKDPGETSQVDNAGPITKTLAQSVQSVNIYAAAVDNFTVADVNATGGPLTGFIAGTGGPIADSTSQANAQLVMDNNSINAVGANGVTLFDFTATTGTATLVLTGDNSGAATNNFCFDLSNGGACGANEIFTLTTNTATRAGIASNQFPPQGTTHFRPVLFNADGTTQLGTARTFAVSGTVTPQVGSPQPFANTNGVNGTWWQWSANASQLMSPYFSTNPQYVTRFFLLNTGALPVGYTAKCFSEGGGAVTNGAKITGTLAANSNNNIDATAICSFGNAPRGAILFTINAPINSVKGTYNIVDKVTGANGFVPLTRPYNVTNTTE